MGDTMKQSFVDDAQRIYEVLHELGVPNSHCSVKRVRNNVHQKHVKIIFGDIDPIIIDLIIHRCTDKFLLHRFIKGKIDNAAKKFLLESGVSI